MTSVSEIPNHICSTFAADDDMVELVEMFVGDLPQRMSLLKTSFQAQDHSLLQRTAHQLKGAGGGYGFPMLTEFAGQLEQALRDGASDEAIGRAYNALLTVCERIRAA